jgi:hypothetical protein
MESKNGRASASSRGHFMVSKLFHALDTDSLCGFAQAGAATADNRPSIILS